MLWLLVFAFTAASVTPQKVYHQYDADYDEYPYIVSIQSQGPYKLQEVPAFRICSGSLISDSWVLTAAHCLVTHAIRIRYGDISLPRNMSSYSTILKMVPHPGYHVAKITHNKFIHSIHASNDIGLLLVEKVAFKGFCKVSSVDYKSLFGQVVTYVGLGTKVSKVSKQKKNSRQEEEHLQSSEGAIGPCEDDSHSRWAGVCIVQKCAVTYENRYQGELGGPLLHDEKIAGVCTDTSQPRTVGFTPISPYLEWLYDTVNETVK